MTQSDHVATIKSALLAISAGELPDMQRYFNDTATFFVPGSVYRIEGLASYFEGTRPFVNAGGTVQYIDLRQAMVHGDGAGSDAAVVTFHFVRRAALDGEPLPAMTGRGTAVIVGGKVEHLHITDNVDVNVTPTVGVAPAATADTAAFVFPPPPAASLGGSIGRPGSSVAPAIGQGGQAAALPIGSTGLNPLGAIARSPGFARLALWGTS